MAKYMQTAAEANEAATLLYDIVESKLSDDEKGAAACLIARLVNYGVRCAPRAVQSTVRLNAVKRAVEGLPVRVTMEKRVIPGSDDRTYNALITTPTVGQASS